jgi:hypothetical protein
MLLPARPAAAAEGAAASDPTSPWSASMLYREVKECAVEPASNHVRECQQYQQIGQYAAQGDLARNLLHYQSALCVQLAGTAHGAPLDM